MKNNLEKTFAKVEKKKRRSSKPKPSAERLGIITGVGASLIASLYFGIYLHQAQIQTVRMERLEDLSKQRAEIAAKYTENYVESVWKKIAIITARPTLNAAIVMQDQEAISGVKQNIHSQFDGIKAVRFIEKNKAELDPGGSPPIRFTELEMIRRAEAREIVLPEAAKIENEWVINFIAPMPHDSEQEVLATMILALEVGPLINQISQNKTSLGELSLEQKFGNGEPIEVFSTGSGSIGRQVFQPVKNSYWQISFRPSYVLLEDAKVDAKIIYGIIALATLVLVFLGYGLGKNIGRRLQAKTLRKPGVGDTETSAASSNSDVSALSLYNQGDILDVEIAKEDEALLGLGDVAEREQPALPQKQEDSVDTVDDADIPDVVFRAYDIRGLAKQQITTELSQLIGQALGSEAIDNGQDTLIVARDARLSSPGLTEFLVRGILSSGCNVLNVGTVPTPLMYFATATLKESQSGVIVTASHNPGEYNGFKIVMNGKYRSEQDIKAIRSRILQKDLYEGDGQETRYDIVPEYIDTIFSDVALAGDVSIVIDAGNAVTANVAPRLFEELGCQVTPLFCDLDGNFPNHSPDPSIESNLQPLIDKVKETEADLGVAFDGDGDRLIVVTASGQIIWPDRLLMLFAKDIVSRNPGADVVFDVKSTKHLAGCITSYGGRPIMWKTGHAPMKNKMLESGALVGGEYSGHIFIKDRWFGFDDGMYAAARLIEIVSLQGETLDEIFDEFPQSPCTPEIRVPVDDVTKFEVIEKLAKDGEFTGGRVTSIDGVRVDFPYGWGLVRASNTSANLTLRFEADDEDSLHKVKSLFAKELKKVHNSIELGWSA